MNADNVKWYVLHTYTGYENQVETNLKMVFDKNNLTDRLVEISIPTEEVVVESNGKKKVQLVKVYPSYVFIKMDYDNSMWHIITQTRGVTGFVGPLGRPLPLTEEEIRRMHLEKIPTKSDYKPGDSVKVNQGPLEGFLGVIEKVDAVNKKVRVSVSMFGRQTPVDLEFYQVEPVEEEAND